MGFYYLENEITLLPSSPAKNFLGDITDYAIGNKLLSCPWS